MEVQEETTTTKHNSNSNTRVPRSNGSDTNNTDNTNRPEMPEMNCENEENCEKPEMPQLDCEDGEEDCVPMMQECAEDDEDCEIPTPPDGMGGMGRGPMSGEGPQGGMMTESPISSGSVLHPVAYLSLGAVSLILAMVISYAGFSKFFKKKPGETFNTGGKFAWYCVTAILVAAGLIALCYFVPIWVS